MLNIKKITKTGLFEDLSWTLVAQTLGNFLRFLLVFIVIRCYSPEEFGLWATITSLAAVIVTGDFGLTNVLRNIASEGLAKGVNGEARTKEAFFAAMTFLFAFAIIGILILTLFRDSSVFEGLFKTNNENLKCLGKEIIIFVLGIFLLNLPLSMTGGLFLSYGEVKETSMIGIANSVITFCVVVGLSMKHIRINVVSIAYFLCSIIASAFSTYYFLRKRKWRFSFLGVKKTVQYMKEMLPSGAGFLGIGFTSSFISNVLTIYAGSMLGLTAAANINVAQKIYTFFMSVLMSIYGPIWARLSKSYFAYEFIKCRKLLDRSLVLTIAIVSIIIIIATLLKDVLVYLIAGSDYEADATIFILVGVCLFSKVVFDNASLLLVAISKLKIVTLGYCVFCSIVFLAFPKIVNVYGFNWMMIALIGCWVTFINFVLLYTRNLLNKKISAY